MNICFTGAGLSTGFTAGMTELLLPIYNAKDKKVYEKD